MHKISRNTEFILPVDRRVIMKTISDIAAERITIDESICNGKPVVRGKRIAVQTILEFLSAGESIEEILAQYPDLEREDITTSLDTDRTLNT